MTMNLQLLISKFAINIIPNSHKKQQAADFDIVNHLTIPIVGTILKIKKKSCL